MARNWRSLGDQARATRCMIWFYSIFPWMLLAFFTPDTQAWSGAFRGGGLVVLLLFYWLEVNPQIKLVKERFDDQYPRKSWEKPVGIASAVMGVLACLFLLGAVASSGEDFGEGLEFQGSSLFYKPPVTKAEALKLGNYLVTTKFFGQTPHKCQLKKSGRTYEFRVVTKKGVEHDEQVIADFRVFARTLSANVFDGAEVDFHMCDHDFRTIRVVIPLGKTFEGSPSTVRTTTITQPPTSVGSEATRKGTTKPDSVYAQVTTEMTKAQVDAILGPGEEWSTSQMGNIEIATMLYKTQNYDISIQYHDGQVASKTRTPRWDRAQ